MGLSAISDLTIANRAHLFYFIYGICRLPHVSLAICEWINYEIRSQFSKSNKLIIESKREREEKAEMKAESERHREKGKLGMGIGLKVAIYLFI